MGEPEETRRVTFTNVGKIENNIVDGIPQFNIILLIQKCKPITKINLDKYKNKKKAIQQHTV